MINLFRNSRVFYRSNTNILSFVNNEIKSLRKFNHNINVLKFDFSTNEKLSNTPINEIPDLKSFLTDNFNRMHNYLRISLTERCNLRCQV
jgi:hypothetical protein